jgi:hypothetical protein
MSPLLDLSKNNHAHSVSIGSGSGTPRSRRFNRPDRQSFRQVIVEAEI